MGFKRVTQKVLSYLVERTECSTIHAQEKEFLCQIFFPFKMFFLKIGSFQLLSD